jgi:UDP-GlcNAc:undecaprenyl-phosphate/decaprenyl-phosphate GlcNAc-1-phosphate transferase
LSTISAALAAFAVTMMAILTLRPVAVAINLVDRPGGRKTHHGKVPVVGGLAMFLGIIFGIGLVESARPLTGTLISAFALVVTVGMVDDRFSVSPWLRLPLQATAAVLMTLGTGTEVSSIGDAFGVGDIHLHGVMGECLTVLFVMTAINAFNMLDGMDGLAGTVAFVALLALGWSAWNAGQHDLAAVCAVIGATTAAFLLFNLPTRRNRRMRCFMGDAGSTLLGVSLAWICIRVSQFSSVEGIPGGAGLSPVNTLWIVGLPIFEFFWTIIRRALRGQSPLTADAEHFHHLLLKAGFGVQGAFMMFLVLTLFLSTVGLSLNALHVPDYVSLLLLFGTGVVIVRSMYWAHGLIRFFPERARRRVAWRPPSDPVRVIAVSRLPKNDR